MKTVIVCPNCGEKKIVTTKQIIPYWLLCFTIIGIIPCVIKMSKLTKCPKCGIQMQPPTVITDANDINKDKK